MTPEQRANVRRIRQHIGTGPILPDTIPEKIERIGKLIEEGRVVPTVKPLTAPVVKVKKIGAKEQAARALRAEQAA